ncbi:MAG TPA: DUF748 domain-containing protein [Polyangia bacterium]|nr:DUF748 domain-containing protein [Polyangia bacterium]
MPAESGRSPPGDWSSALFTGVLACLLSCAHHPAAPAKSADAQPARDSSPGARTEAERTHVLEAQWSEVEVKGRKEGDVVVSAIKLVQPKIRIFHAAPPPEDASAAQKKKETTAQPSGVVDLNELLHKITPLEVDHIDILDGQVAFVDTSRQERPELWLHDLQLSVENLTNRVRLTEGRPVLLTASATLARSGAVSILITADPFEKGLTFSGRAAIVGLETSELYRFIKPATKLQAPEGTIDLFVEFDCRNGQLTGGVKPVLKNVKIRPDDKGFFTAIKAWVTDVAVKLFSDRVKDRNAVATVIPIKGTLTGAGVNLWPTIFGVLRNAFIEGLTSGYAYLPPKTSEAPTAPGAQPSPSESHSTSPPAAP